MPRVRIQKLCIAVVGSLLIGGCAGQASMKSPSLSLRITRMFFGLLVVIGGLNFQFVAGIFL